MQRPQQPGSKEEITDFQRSLAHYGVPASLLILSAATHMVLWMNKSIPWQWWLFSLVLHVGGIVWVQWAANERLSVLKRQAYQVLQHRPPDNGLKDRHPLLATDVEQQLHQLHRQFYFAREQDIERATQTLRDKQEKLQAILNSIADGVIVCDADGLVLMMNPAAANLLGLGSPELMNGCPLESYVTEEGTPCFEEVLTEYRKARKNSKHPSETATPWIREMMLPAVTLQLEMTPLSPLPGAEISNGTTPGFVMTLHDLTREAHIRDLKANFISNVSHELRTPITTIKSYVDTLYHYGDDLDQATFKEFLETVHTETDRLKELINDILDISRLESSEVVLEKTPTDLTKLLLETAQAFKLVASKKKLLLRVSYPEQAPLMPVHALTIQRVIRNLIDNAIKYTEEGGSIWVRMRLNETRDLVEVTIEDTGCGIPEEHLPHLFNRFYRVETKVHTIRGTGLGLHLVKAAVEHHHHGRVFVKSQLGIGSTFGFTLPIYIGERPPLALPGSVRQDTAAHHASADEDEDSSSYYDADDAMPEVIDLQPTHS